MLCKKYIMFMYLQQQQQTNMPKTGNMGHSLYFQGNVDYCKYKWNITTYCKRLFSLLKAHGGAWLIPNTCWWLVIANPLLWALYKHTVCWLNFIWQAERTHKHFLFRCVPKLALQISSVSLCSLSWRFLHAWRTSLSLTRSLSQFDQHPSYTHTKS